MSSQDMMSALERELADRVVAALCVDAADAVRQLGDEQVFTQHEWCLDGRVSGGDWPPRGLRAAASPRGGFEISARRATPAPRT